MRISDWSSDVCSSDLLGHCGLCLLHFRFSQRLIRLGKVITFTVLLSHASRHLGGSVNELINRAVKFAASTIRGKNELHQRSSQLCSRSEERRVGQESVSTCRYRWQTYH